MSQTPPPRPCPRTQHTPVHHGCGAREVSRYVPTSHARSRRDAGEGGGGRRTRDERHAESTPLMHHTDSCHARARRLRFPQMAEEDTHRSGPTQCLRDPTPPQNHNAPATMDAPPQPCSQAATGAVPRQTMQNAVPCASLPWHRRPGKDHRPRSLLQLLLRRLARVWQRRSRLLLWRLLARKGH